MYIFVQLFPAPIFFFFFFNDTATTEIYTLSLHDALPIYRCRRRVGPIGNGPRFPAERGAQDRKSTRLNSSHGYISYAVFCLKKKKKTNTNCLSTKVHHVAHIHFERQSRDACQRTSAASNV